MSPIFMAWFSDYLALKYSSTAATTDSAAKHTSGKKKPKKIDSIMLRPHFWQLRKMHDSSRKHFDNRHTLPCHAIRRMLRAPGQRTKSRFFQIAQTSRFGKALISFAWHRFSS
jgi:hypothetical protein